VPVFALGHDPVVNFALFGLLQHRLHIVKQADLALVVVGHADFPPRLGTLNGLFSSLAAVLDSRLVHVGVGCAFKLHHEVVNVRAVLRSLGVSVLRHLLDTGKGRLGHRPVLGNVRPGSGNRLAYALEVLLGERGRIKLIHRANNNAHDVVCGHVVGNELIHAVIKNLCTLEKRLALAVHGVPHGPADLSLCHGPADAPRNLVRKFCATLDVVRVNLAHDAARSWHLPQGLRKVLGFGV